MPTADCDSADLGSCIGIIWPDSLALDDYAPDVDTGTTDNTERCPLHDRFDDDAECTCDDGEGFDSGEVAWERLCSRCGQLDCKRFDRNDCRGA